MTANNSTIEQLRPYPQYTGRYKHSLTVRFMVTIAIVAESSASSVIFISNNTTLTECRQESACVTPDCVKWHN